MTDEQKHKNEVLTKLMTIKQSEWMREPYKTWIQQAIDYIKEKR